MSWWALCSGSSGEGSSGSTVSRGRAAQGQEPRLRGEPGLAAACLDARGAAAASDGRGEEPQDRGWAPGGWRMQKAAGSSIRPAALRPWGLPERKAGDPRSSPTPPGCRHPLPSPSLSPRHTGPSPGAAGHRMEGWESPGLLASKPARGACSRVPFSAPAFVEAKYSCVLAARKGRTGDCPGFPAWSSPDGPLYRNVVCHEAELIPCLFPASSWKALGAQERSCEGRSHVPRWGDSGAWPRAHLMRLHVSFDPQPCPGLAGCSHMPPRTRCPQPSPRLGGHQPLPEERDAVLFPTSLLPSS